MRNLVRTLGRALGADIWASTVLDSEGRFVVLDMDANRFVVTNVVLDSEGHPFEVVIPVLGSVAKDVVAYTALNSAGTAFGVPAKVLDTDANAFTVTADVLDSAATPFSTV